MAEFNENVSVNGTLTLFNLEGSALEVTSFEGFPNAGIHMTTTGGSGTPHIRVGATGTAIHGESPRGMGVHGMNDAPVGGSNKPQFGCGVWGESTNGFGVFGSADNNVGVFGTSVNSDGVQGKSQNARHSGVSGINEGGGIGVFGAGATAGQFNGPVNINGNLTMQGGGDVILADCAEEFECSSRSVLAEPGYVMVLDDSGVIRPCNGGYERGTVGVVSGAGTFRPAIVLDRIQDAENRAPIALIGKVCCYVDANFTPIRVGDLLTTSPTTGHAMKAIDHTRAFGAVIGKALQPLAGGKGLIAILVTLQ